MICKGQTHYSRADFPPESIQEVKWTAVLRAHPEAKTPQAVLEAIPDAAPSTSLVLQPVPGHAGSWFFNRAALEDIPPLDWAQLYLHGGGTAAVADAEAAAAAAEAG